MCTYIFTQATYHPIEEKEPLTADSAKLKFDDPEQLEQTFKVIEKIVKNTNN